MLLTSHSIAGRSPYPEPKQDKTMTHRDNIGRDGYCSNHLNPIPGNGDRGLNGEVREIGEKSQTFTVKIELDATDVQRTIAEVNKQFGDFLETVKAEKPIFQVFYIKKSGRHAVGFQSTADINSKNGFFQTNATPELQGTVLVSMEEVSHIVCEPYKPESKSKSL